MDRQPEELQYLGAFGIVAQSFKVLRSCFKLLGLKTLTLLVPFSFGILARSLLTHRLSHNIATAKDGSLAGEVTLHQLYRKLGQMLLIDPFYMTFQMAFSLLSTSAVVYTVACLYTGREFSYANVISVVPRVWRRLMITFLWFFGIMFVYYVAVQHVIILWVLIIGVDKTNSGLFWFGIVVIIILVLCVYVYISMVWQLASVVSVVEQNYGLGAMKKSWDLIKGKLGTALALCIISTITFGIISFLFKSILLTVVGERFADVAVLVVVESAENVMWLLIQSVFYFVCKSYHHENIHKSALSDSLEGYLVEYMPLKGNIQLEHLDP